MYMFMQQTSMVSLKPVEVLCIFILLMLEEAC